jgi:hypothetical protein
VVECEIIHVSSLPESQPSYEALSYVWGDANNTTAITVDGRIYQVTINLECALRYLRLLDTKRLLWIDAICINQQDEREKETQVRAMAAIYKQSAMVLVWLGEETDGSIHQDRPPQMPISNVFEIISRVAKGQEIAHLVGDNPWDRWTPSLLDFLRRVWFRRLWIVQETAMTPNPILICGRWSIPWASLYGAHRRLGATLGFTAYGATSMRAAFQNYDALLNCWTAHQYWKDDKAIPAEELARRLIRLLLTLKGNFLCSDERDRLYGILGMVGHPELSMQIPIDYQKSASIVFRDLAVFLVNSRKSLDFLVGDRASFNSSNYPGKPSWVPTWKSFSTYTRGIYVLPYIWTRGEEEEPRSSPLAHYRLSEDHNILYVKGSIIGGIVGLGTPPPHFPNDFPANSRHEDHRRALSQLLIMWETEVVHLPLLRARGGDHDIKTAYSEMLALWKTDIVPLPSLHASYTTEKIATAEFMKALFHSKEPGSRSGLFSEYDCYNVLLGRKECSNEDEDDPSSEVGRFAYFKWRDIHDMAPFRLSSGHFGMLELDEDIYQGELLIVLFSGGPGPVALRREEGGYRYMGPCYVHGLAEDSWQAILDSEGSTEFALI